MTWKIHYNSQTTLVEGKYKSEFYKTCPSPFLEISDQEYGQKFGNGSINNPCVINGKIEEFQKSLPELLQQAKIAKLTELKTKFDAELISPHNSHKAEELLVDELQQETLTNKQVYFLFKTQATGIPVTEPYNLLTNIRNHVDPNYHLRYFCTIVENDVQRKGYVKITKKIAEDIQAHMALRGTTSVSKSVDIQSLINAATTIEEVNQIEIQF